MINEIELLNHHIQMIKAGYNTNDRVLSVQINWLLFCHSAASTGVLSKNEQQHIAFLINTIKQL